MPARVFQKLETGEQIFENLNADTDEGPQNMKKNITQALRNSDIPTLKPEFLKKQLQETKQEISQALKQISISPNDSDQIVQTLIDKIKKRSEVITQKIDRSALIKRFPIILI